MSERVGTAADREAGWVVQEDFAPTGYNPGEIGPQGTVAALMATGIRCVLDGEEA